MASEKPTKREIPRAYQTGRRSGSYSSRGHRSSSDGSGHTKSPGAGWPWDGHCVIAARALVFLSLAYATWRFAGTDSACHVHLSVMLGAASILTLATQRTFVRKSRRLPVVIFTIGLLWIGYAAVQTLPMVAKLELVFAGQESIQHRITTPAVGRLEAAIMRLDESQTPLRYQATGSIDSNRTVQAMVPCLLALAIMVLSAILFDSRQSRTAYLWFLVFHTGLLAAWGVVQRAGGNAYILPGIEHQMHTIPFASFVYKNAGAAAILPGLAAIAALIYGDRDPSLDGSSAKKLDLRVFLLQPKIMTLMAVLGLLTAGLLASLSRGAWVSALLACMVAVFASRIKISTRQAAVLIVSLVAVIASVFALTGIRDTVVDRANQVTVTNLTVNQRWEHWKDGIMAAWYYLPSGSGLGTYGYASLPAQSGPKPFWFREAHNQYLEVLAESGLCGIVLLLIAMIWFGVIVWRLLRQDEHREKSSWGLLGLMILVCGAVQSIFDFVLKIPANMFLYASLMGVVAATERSYIAYLRSRSEKRSLRISESKDPIRKTELKYSLFRMPASWCLLGLGAVTCGGFQAYRQSQTDQVLGGIRNSENIGRPTAESLRANLALLDEAVSRQPRRVDALRQRATWRFFEYRLQLLDAASESGDPIQWDDTRSESIESTIALLDQPARQKLITELLATPLMRRQVASTLADLMRSMQSNPLDPATHLTCLFLAPLTGMPVEPWVKSCAELNKNSSQMLYSTGLVAYQHGLFDLAIEQWSQSLVLDEKYLEDIYLLSREKLTAKQIAGQLIPPHRSDVLVRLVRDANTQSVMVAADVGEELIEYLNDQSIFEPAATQATLGGIYQILGDQQEAVEHWEKATELDAKNAIYRLRFAASLRLVGRYEEALHQSILGGTLAPDDARFSDMTLRIRGDIRRQREFD